VVTLGQPGQADQRQPAVGLLQPLAPALFPRLEPGGEIILHGPGRCGSQRESRSQHQQRGEQGAVTDASTKRHAEKPPSLRIPQGIGTHLIAVRVRIGSTRAPGGALREESTMNATAATGSSIHRRRGATITRALLTLMLLAACTRAGAMRDADGSGDEMDNSVPGVSQGVPQEESRMKTDKPTDEELRRRLTPLQYQVTQHEGTERTFATEYYDHNDTVNYVTVLNTS